MSKLVGSERKEEVVNSNVHSSLGDTILSTSQTVSLLLSLECTATDQRTDSCSITQIHPSMTETKAAILLDAMGTNP